MTPTARERALIEAVVTNLPVAMHQAQHVVIKRIIESFSATPEPPEQPQPASNGPASAAENPSGLHRRYIVSKADGSPVDPRARYFVLRVDWHGDDVKHIAACRAAAKEYATKAPPHMERTAMELLAWMDEPVEPQLSSLIGTTWRNSANGNIFGPVDSAPKSADFAYAKGSILNTAFMDGVRWVQVQPEAEPTPSRVGTWWVSKQRPADVFGPVTWSHNGYHFDAARKSIMAGQWLPIPPRPTVPGWEFAEVRVPKLDEYYAMLSGDVARCLTSHVARCLTSHGPCDEDGEAFGGRRWIARKVAKPAGTATLSKGSKP